MDRLGRGIDWEGRIDWEEDGLRKRMGWEEGWVKKKDGWEEE